MSDDKCTQGTRPPQLFKYWATGDGAAKIRWVAEVGGAAARPPISATPWVCDVCYLDVDEPGRWRHAKCTPAPPMVRCDDCGTRFPATDLLAHYRRTDGPSECHRRRAGLQVVR